MERTEGMLHLGEQIDAKSGDRNGEAVAIESADLTTHGVIVGMTGSGKTGLGVGLLEEALLSGIPVLAIDPKGDLGNLALTFPNLEPDDFKPWIEPGAADSVAAETAENWKSGLNSWGLGSSDIQDLADRANPIIYTPGGTAGVPLDALGRLSAPTTDDPSARQEEVDSTVSGLLGLIGIESDPLSGREHILLANLITRSWDTGKDLDMSGLINQILDPPIRKLGVLDLDQFFPAKDRQALAMKLNGLLASPSFSAWAKGAPLDIEKMLYTPDGKARAAIVSLVHLEESERQFAVGIILSKLVSWMKSKQGTQKLRALVYIDEVMGLAPPVGNPAPKKPILTLLKQARAFGVGLVLSTQNPVDLDYKALSNTGTWMIGRLQTEQDKKRLVDGLKASDGSVDLAATEATISSLDKRQFILRTTRSSDLTLFGSRWAMSFLAGPLTRNQIGSLMADEIAALKPAAAPAPALADGASDTESSDSAPAASSDSAPAASSDSAPAAAQTSSSRRELGDDETSVAPALPVGIPVRYLAKSAPWMSEIEADSDGTRLEAMLAARVNLLYDDTKSKLRHNEEWEAIIPLGSDKIDLDGAISVDFDDRDFVDAAPENASYALLPFELSKTALSKAQANLKNTLQANHTQKLAVNNELKLYSRPGEEPKAFKARCVAGAEDGADQAANALRDKLEKKRDTIEAALAKAEDRVEELEAQTKGRRNQQLIDVGTSILGGLLGGRRRTSGMASSARRMASGSRQKSSSKARLSSAENRLEEKAGQLEDLEQQLQDEIIEIDDLWRAKAAKIEELEVPLEKTDITIEDFLIVWVPKKV